MIKNLFCKHEYEIKEVIRTCTEIIFQDKCTQCGKIKINRIKINNHKFKEFYSSEIMHVYTNGITGYKFIFKCDVCGEIKEETIRI